MQKAIIVYVSVLDAYKTKRRPEVLADALKELNDCLDNGWAVKQSTAMGTGSESAACNLVILEKS